MKYFQVLPVWLFVCSAIFAQTNVRAWYAQGQVWIVWQIDKPNPETYGIYKRSTPFNQTADATLIGRPFHYEYLPGTYWEQTGDTTFTYRIPGPGGGTYQLASGEALFVETVTHSGAAYYAVAAWGNTAVTPGVNMTQNLVQFNYDPINQPVNCHLQLIDILPTGHKSLWFSMWAMGRQDENAGRPDFPVLANAAKNGMPSMFIISQSLSLDTAGGKKFPMTHFLHGGGMLANQFLANDFDIFNIEPIQGISVSHNDDFGLKTIIETGDSVFTSGRTLWFGWTKRHDPFDYHFKAGPGDTVINYTQRRIVWINDWLIKQFPIHPDHVAVMGYSMGSGGATALAKTYPEKFSTACLFNCGLRSGVDPTSQAIVGSIAMNLPTSLKGFSGETKHINDVFDLNSRLSPSRDFPLVRLWVGKNDINDRMYWAADMVVQLRLADSLGWGTQINWDERPHTYQNANYHWLKGFASNQQTLLDNLSFQEDFQSNISFPAFFNHHLDVQNNDPGDGTPGTGPLGVGDDWGTWGGYHRWENTQENSTGWRTTAWIESKADYDNDNCPSDFLTTDVAIRKPQQFKPTSGTTLFWQVVDSGTNQLLQNGTTTVQSDALVVIPKVKVFKSDTRKVKIEVSTKPVSTEDYEKNYLRIDIRPNPSNESSHLIVQAEKEVNAKIIVSDLCGKVQSIEMQFQPGENHIPLDALVHNSAGYYMVSIKTERHTEILKWIRQ